MNGGASKPKKKKRPRNGYPHHLQQIENLFLMRKFSEALQQCRSILENMREKSEHLINGEAYQLYCDSEPFVILYMQLLYELERKNEIIDYVMLFYHGVDHLPPNVLLLCITFTIWIEDYENGLKLIEVCREKYPHLENELLSSEEKISTALERIEIETEAARLAEEAKLAKGQIQLSKMTIIQDQLKRIFEWPHFYKTVMFVISLLLTYYLGKGKLYKLYKALSKPPSVDPEVELTRISRGSVI
eukprot:TRINITY_DN2953_c3_g1_i1.p1 TRINITY_DN2953_c3_g1~~TRINITY_DN2953_c3_g1_i1.p1  ORF type:complete len:245 (-),score=43.15 TRINITY_DN2953_c3_g1_i1:705-1439(-)